MILHARYKTIRSFVVCGETGSGKTDTASQNLSGNWVVVQNGLIGHTQPRRIAASSTAGRIARELNSPTGEIVGYKIRFTDKLQTGASVKLMTDGILLAETQNDRLLKQYDTIIIDEAHERSLNIDFLLGYLKQLLPKRPDLKIIITSATIDAERLQNISRSVTRPFRSSKCPAGFILSKSAIGPSSMTSHPKRQKKTGTIQGKAVT